LARHRLTCCTSPSTTRAGGLVEAAWRLAEAYARRLTGGNGCAGQVALFVLPRIVLDCVYGMDTDPLTVDLARLALSLETDGQVPPQALARTSGPAVAR
jgi:hypothetical protein